MDETGQAGSPDTASAYRGRGGHTEAQSTPDGTWGNNGQPPSDDALAAVVSGWRDPVTGQVSGVNEGRAGPRGAGQPPGVTREVNGSRDQRLGHEINGARDTTRDVNGSRDANGARGRAEVRPPYSDLLASMNAPMPMPTQQFSQPPAEQPPTDRQPTDYDQPPAAPVSGPAGREAPPPAVLHYGHYGPDGQGWPTEPPTDRRQPSLPTGHQVPPAYDADQAETTAAGQQYSGPQQVVYPPQHAQRHPKPPPSAPPFPAQPHYAEPPQQQRHAEQPPQQQRYVERPQQYTAEPPQPEQPPYAEPAPPTTAGYEETTSLFDQRPPTGPEYDWAARAYPTQRTPADRLPNDPLNGPLPSDALTDDTPASGSPSLLPQRVPAEPDVPAVPEVEPIPAGGLPAGTPDLARIATYLRHDEEELVSPDGRPDGFDIPAVLDAVRGVAGVREASLRANPNGVHTLRLDLADDADPGRVSRAVARLLNQRMGLAAEPSLPEVPASTPTSARPAQATRGPVAPPPYSALPSYGRDARRRRPVSGVRRGPDRVERPTVVAGSSPTSAPVPPPAPAQATAPASVSAFPAAFVPAPTSASAGADERESRSMERAPGVISSPRVVIDQVEVSTQGVDAVVEVRLTADGHPAVGVASGPSVDGYILRLSAAAAAAAIDELLVDIDSAHRARCYIEHAAVVPLGGCEVAVVVLLLMCDGWVEQLTGSAVVAGDPRQAVVRATLAAVNRRLEALLP